MAYCWGRMMESGIVQENFTDPCGDPGALYDQHAHFYFGRKFRRDLTGSRILASELAWTFCFIE